MNRLPLWDESILLVRARSPREATKKAASLGRSLEHSYKNSLGELVRWVFVRTLDVELLVDQSLAHGTEVFSRLIRRKRGYQGE